MRNRVLALLGAFFIAAVGAFALASPASATEPGGVVTKYETGLMDFGPNGYGGYSCPAGSTVVEGGYTQAEAGVDVKFEGKMEADTDYPHHNTGPGETGWYVQNGETGQKLNVWVKCITPLTEVAAEAPTVVAPTCDLVGKVTAASTEGVEYVVVSDNGSVTLVAKAEAGYKLKGKTRFGPYPVAKLTGEKCGTAPPAEAKDCEAYTYAGTTTNLCADFPAVTDNDCDNVKFRVVLGDKAVDPWNLDGTEKDGIGCEANPVKPGAPGSDNNNAGGGGGDGGGGILPVTGAEASLIAVVGTGIVGGGIALFLVGRRRRIRTVA